MTFWSGERLRQNLSQIIDQPNPDQIDRAAYTLRIGPEIYVTPHVKISDPDTVTKRQISDKESFTIPAGQFAFLLTEESVSIPFTQIGFISIRAKIKFRGLVNVSGFHVDPGYQGRLIFSVYNAGPAALHFARGDQAFLLWIADLDDLAKEDDARDDTPRLDISTNLISGIPGKIYSLQSLYQEHEEIKQHFRNEFHSIDKKVDGIYTYGKIYASLLVILITFLLRGPIADEFKNLFDSSQPTVTNSTNVVKPGGPP